MCAIMCAAVCTTMRGVTNHTITLCSTRFYQLTRGMMARFMSTVGVMATVMTGITGTTTGSRQLFVFVVVMTMSAILFGITIFCAFTAMTLKDNLFHDERAR